MERQTFIISSQEIPDSAGQGKSTDTTKPRVDYHKKGYEFLLKASKKYLLTIQSKLNIGGFISETEVEIRWLLNLKEITDAGYVFELITLDNIISKDDNSGFSEIHALVRQIQKALNEIKFRIDRRGNLLQVINIDDIKERWSSVKRQAFDFNREATNLSKVFSLHDEVFEHQGGIEKMVNALEFFDIYLGNLYGRKFPFNKVIERPNLFRTQDIQFDLYGSEQRHSSTLAEVTLKSTPTPLSQSQLKRAYGNFPFVQIERLAPHLSFSAKYQLNLVSGFLEQGEICYVEEVSDKLGGTIIYKFKSYE